MVRTANAALPRVSSTRICSQLDPGNSVAGLRAKVMNVEDCSTAKPMVRYRVYCVSFCCPDWPSFFSTSKRGITTVNNCTMMLAVMYGMMPSAKMDS